LKYNPGAVPSGIPLPPEMG
jgi:hypothetical protein